jgi:TRAP-type C4-dicarboxylate transport system permease large subunit
VVIPLFILTTMVISNTGIAIRLFNTAHKRLGQLLSGPGLPGFVISNGIIISI